MNDSTETEKIEAKLVLKLEEEYDSKVFESYYQVNREEMLEYVPHQALNILDIGCADGNFGYLLKKRNSAEVWGVEPNEKAANIASKRLDKVICDSFGCQLELPKNYFDCIILNDVLEHLVDPFSALLYMKELLSNKGVIVASIPNVRYFDNVWKLLVHKDWEYTDWGILDKTHLRFFTHKSVVKTFDSLGYEVKVIEGINPLKQFHAHHWRRFVLLNLLCFNQIADMKYLQFAIVAKPHM